MKETGLSNNITNMWKRPRCGVPDYPVLKGELHHERHRQRRFVLYGGRLDKTDLTYRLIFAHWQSNTNYTHLTPQTNLHRENVVFFHIYREASGLLLVCEIIVSLFWDTFKLSSFFFCFCSILEGICKQLGNWKHHSCIFSRISAVFGVDSIYWLAYLQQVFWAVFKLFSFCFFLFWFVFLYIYSLIFRY